MAPHKAQHSLHGWLYVSNNEISVSRPFAPAYIFLGLGAEYATKNKDKLLYLSPFKNNNGIGPTFS
jgi:hypothetical protein